MAKTKNAKKKSVTVKKDSLAKKSIKNKKKICEFC